MFYQTQYLKAEKGDVLSLLLIVIVGQLIPISMNNKTSYLEKLLKIEKRYNLYKLNRKQAREEAKPLIKAFNKKALEVSLDFKMKPTKVSIYQFSFGR